MAPIFASEKGSYFCSDCYTPENQQPKLQRTTSWTNNNSNRVERNCKWALCTYKTSNVALLDKHENWTCSSSQNSCTDCGKILQKESVMAHLLRFHRDSKVEVRYSCGSKVADVIFSNYLRDKWYGPVVSVHNVAFKIVFFYNKDFMSVSVVSGTSEHPDKYFQCGYNIIFHGQQQNIRGVMNVITEEHLETYKLVRDWRLELCQMNTKLESFSPACTFILEIVKRPDIGEIV